MSSAVRKFAVASGAAVLLVLALVAFGAWSGAYNFAADERHSRPVQAAIEFLRERSVRVRAAGIEVPNLRGKQELLVAGAGNYEAMCAQCHLSPGKESTELSRGLYPSPPDLSRKIVDPAKSFWTIKHGIKASGMPAWGKSMSDADIWNIVALLQQLPTLDQAGYRQLVAASSGHSHAGMPGASGMSHDKPQDAPRARADQTDGADPHSEAGHPHGPGENH